MRMSRLRKWLWGAVAVIAGAVCLLIVRQEYFADPLIQAYFYEPWQTGSREYHAARNRWQARPFDGYHLTFQYQVTQLQSQSGQIPADVTTTCEVEVTIADRAEQQIAVASNSCPAAVPHSIAQMFALFEERANRPVGKSPTRDPSTRCYNMDVGYLDLIAADYDSAWGNPRQIGNKPSVWDLTGDCWSSILMIPEAAFVPRQQIIITDLTPLP